MEVLAQVGQFVAMLLGAAFCLLSVAMAYWIMEACYYQGRLARQLEKDLGFEIDSEYLNVPGSIFPHDVIRIWKLTEGGIFSQAGFRVGQVLPGFGLTEFYKLLHRGRGKQVQIEVAEGGEGPPFVDRPRQAIRFLVPSKRAIM